MRFESYRLGNRHVLKTYKTDYCTRAVFFKDTEFDKTVENIHKNGWQITFKEIR